MVINSISIVPQDVPCNAKCRYCIACLTCSVRKNLKKPGIILPKLEKCLKFACDQNCSTGIITSSGETLLGSWTNIENILWLCRKYLGQMDLHTNGSEILAPPTFGRDFSQMLAPYLTNVTITIPHYDTEICEKEHGLPADHNRLITTLVNLGLVVRLSCVMYKGGIDNLEKMKTYIDHFKKLGVSKIVFRELWIPEIETDGSLSFKTWCFNHRTAVKPFISDLKITKELNLWANRQPYIYNGVEVSSSTCTENNSSTVIKSVVYRPDNFLYYDWDTTCKMM